MNRRLLENKGDTNREVIESYLVSEEGSVILNEQQQTLLKRWTFADEKIRSHEMKRETIAQLIMSVFKVSRVTAYQDIVNAEALFSSSSPLNKKYRIQLRIEFLEMKIQELYGLVHMNATDEAGNPIPAEEEDIEARVLRIEGNQEYLHEAKELEKVLQKYYHDYPDIAPPRAPRTVIYNINFEKLPTPKYDINDAIDRANQILHLKANDEKP